MSIMEHTAAPQSFDFEEWRAAARDDHGAVAQQAAVTHEAWADMPADPRGRPSSRAEATFEASRLILLTLLTLVILAPFAPGLILLGLLAAILAVPYLLLRRVFGGR
jgi:hypothetical protein